MYSSPDEVTMLHLSDVYIASIKLITALFRVNTTKLRNLLKSGNICACVWGCAWEEEEEEWRRFEPKIHPVLSRALISIY